MKKTMFLGIIGMLLPLFSYGQTVQETEMEKVYVTASQLAITNQKIFAFLEGQWIPVNGIHSDALGVYIKPCIDYARIRWICECGYNNDGEAATCQKDLRTGGKCGKPRPSHR
jgi:hypothetical protein